MAFAANYSARWKIDYKSAGKNHSFTVRLPSDSTGPTVTNRTSLGLGIEFLANYLPNDFAFLDGTFCPAGGDEFLSSLVPVTSLKHSTDGYDWQNDALVNELAGEVKFHWKSTGGSTNFSIFGWMVDAFTAAAGLRHKAPLVAVSTVNSAATKFAEIPVAGSNGILATMRNYITYQRNSYHEGR